jgi:hypothetical protein
MHDRHAERLARFGYAARGVVYLLVGGLALLAAFGNGGQTTDSKGALQTLLTHPLGGAWVAAIGIGLICFALWRIAQAIFDADHLGREWKAVVRRIGFTISAMVYTGLAFTAFGSVLGLGAASAEGERSVHDWTASVLAAPLGEWLVGATGVIVGVVGAAFLVRAISGRFAERLALDARARAWVLPLGRLGFTARGLVFLMAGYFLVNAALLANANEARGLAGALRKLQDQPYGWLLLGSAALGIFAFGLFQIAVAYYRRIDAQPIDAAERKVERAAKGMASAAT